MRRIGRGSIEYTNKPYIIGYAAVGGVKEAEGPLGGLFDRTFDDNLVGESSWEKAESRILQEAVNICVDKSGLTNGDIDMIFSGDLLNQCIASTFGLRNMKVPHIGMYGACSTMALTLLTAGVYVDSGGANTAVAATSSHFSSAERQYRMPLQYGGQRTPTAQWTVTGAGAAALSAEKKTGVYLRRATVGIIDELGIKDANNMGAAMAPAAAGTIKRFLEDSGHSVEDIDVIMTGDLGTVGSELLCELLLTDGIDIRGRHQDGGAMIYDIKRQDAHAGGSGCGCSASVLCAVMLPRLERGEIKNMLFVATGALLSPTTIQQGEVIPSIAHAVEIAAG